MATQFDEGTPALTRNGTWLAYTSNQSGQNEIYMQSLDGTSGRLQVSTAGGTEPVWSADGRELFYRGGAEQLMVATVETRPVPRVTSRRALFGVADILETNDEETFYDVSPDGKHFVMVQRNRVLRASPDDASRGK